MFPKHLEWQFHDDPTWAIFLGLIRHQANICRIGLGKLVVQPGWLWRTVTCSHRHFIFVEASNVPLDGPHLQNLWDCNVVGQILWEALAKKYRFPAWKHSGQDWASSCRKKSVQVAGRVFAEKLMGEPLGYLRVWWVITMTSQSVARWPFNINMTSFWGNHLSLKFVEIY